MLVIGHRGASAAAPENTVEAFVLAHSMGADGVELDVRLAPDGRLVVKHDPLPDDPDELDRYPQLDVVLAACGDLLINVEIKNSADEPGHDPACRVVEPTIAVMRAHGADDRWIVSSFDWATIERCREVAPEIATAYLVMEATPEIIERTAEAGHRAVHPWVGSLTAASVVQCHASGLAVNTWTCNDPERMGELAEWGVDGVCTDVPDIGRSVVGTRAATATARWGRPA